MHIKAVTLFFALIFLFISAGISCAQKETQPASMQSGDSRLLYMKTVQEYVNKQWSYKKTLDNQFYSVQLDLILDREGRIIEQKILKLSSDQVYNDYALKALAKMEPYPPIPDTLDVENIQVRFHLMPNK